MNLSDSLIIDQFICQISALLARNLYVTLMRDRYVARLLITNFGSLNISFLFFCKSLLKFYRMGARLFLIDLRIRHIECFPKYKYLKIDAIYKNYLQKIYFWDD